MLHESGADFGNSGYIILESRQEQKLNASLSGAQEREEEKQDTRPIYGIHQKAQPRWMRDWESWPYKYPQYGTTNEIFTTVSYIS
jgi:hypothetical protein